MASHIIAWPFVTKNAKWRFRFGPTAPTSPSAATAGFPASITNCATYRETNYGPQLEIQKIRAITAADKADGFDPWMCLAHSRYDGKQMFAELVAGEGTDR